MASSAPTPEASIEQLLSAQPYNPEIIPDLEAHLDHQVSSGSYHLEANLALLRLYQFEPARLSLQRVAQVLLKAMMTLPRVDATLCLGLIAETALESEPVATLASLTNLLESCQFEQFWHEAGQQKELLGTVSGFEEAIRGYAVHVLGLSFKRVPRHVLAEAVNINGPSLDDFIQRGVQTKGWFVSKTKNGEVIELGVPGAEPFLHKGVAESVPFEHVARLFPVLS